MNPNASTLQGMWAQPLEPRFVGKLIKSSYQPFTQSLTSPQVVEISQNV